MDDGAGDPIADSRGAGELRRLCRAVVEELGVHGATVTVMASDGTGAAEAASDDDIGKLDQLQFVLGEGPSGDAYASGRPVLVSDLAATGDRWMAFTAAALTELVGAVYAFPLQYGAVRLGVLTCYSSDPRALTAREVARCLSFAEAVRDLLLDAVADADGVGQEVQQSLRIRREVYQAQGMLMVELGISLSEALTRLRAMAFSEGLDLNELASDLANRRRPMPTRGDSA